MLIIGFSSNKRVRLLFLIFNTAFYQIFKLNRIFMKCSYAYITSVSNFNINLTFFQMKLTVTDGNNFISLEVEPDQQIQDVKALLEIESKIPMNQIDLFLDGKPLKDSETLSQKGISQSSLVYFAVVKRQAPKKGIGIADMIKNFDKQIKQVNEEGYQFNHRRVEQFIPQAKRIMEEVKNDPFKLSSIGQAHPDIVGAIERGDVSQLAKIMHGNNQKKIKDLKQKQRRFIELSKDPMNPEYQKLLEERISQQNIDKNLEFANQYIPEVFGHINMLYIKASINKIPIQAFVDSGAQSTTMSQSLAQRCGLMRLVDKRYAGKAIGVGSCKILGKIHAAEIEIEGKYLTCAFTVIQNNSTEFLLGLDMLKRFNCIIDLKKNVLVFQDGMITTKFLSDGEIQKNRQPASKEQVQKKLKKLMDLGFSKADAAEALRECGYNQQVASNILMQRKFGNK